MKRIPINNIEKKYQHMAWTEEQTGAGYTKEEYKAYHYSNSEIKEFAATTTCFFHYFWNMRKGMLKGENIVHNGEYLYELTIPKGTYVELYDNEVRVNLTPDMIIYDVTKKHTQRPTGIELH